MIQNVLATKFHQPAPSPRRIARPQLLARLNEGLQAGRPLTLVSAPAGFGKTTCIVDWLLDLQSPTSTQQSSIPNLQSSWLSLEPADDDPLRFFTCFAAALQKIDPALGQPVETLLLHSAGELPALDTLSTTLINAITSAQRQFLLVLDDFQVIQDRAILQVLERLILNQPGQLHLVLVTREDPQLPLARLRANDRLTEIRAADLRLSAEETGRFLQDLLGLSLPAEDVALLDNRTEGWVAGLQLAGLSLRGRPDPSRFIAALSGNQRHILGYLTEEVLSRQPEEIQQFLLETSILESMCAELCETVRENGEQKVENSGDRSLFSALRSLTSQSILDYLDSSNLFLISLDDEGRWYRYHHLFLDLLRNLQSRLPRDRVQELHRRAGVWYEQAGMPGDAIEHALAAQDYPTAVRLIESHAMPVLTQGYGKTVEGWMRALPLVWRTHSPRANLAFAWLHVLRGSYAKVAPYLELVEAAVDPADPQDEEASALRAELYALQSNLFNVQGKPAESIAAATQALQTLTSANPFVLGQAYLGLGGAYRLLGDYPRLSEAYRLAIQESRAAGNVLSEMLATTALTLTAIQVGQLHFAAETGAQAIERIERAGGSLPPIAGIAYGSVGVVYYEWNQLDRARQYFEQGSRLSGLVGHNAGLVYSRVLMARLLQAEDDLQGALRLTQEAVDLLPAGVPAWLKPEVAAQQVRMALAQRSPAAAEAVLQENGLSLQDALPHENDLLSLAKLRVILYRAQEAPGRQALWETGLGLAGQLIAGAAQKQRMGIALQALLLRARLRSGLRDVAGSQNDLREALALGEPQGYLRTFLDEGEEMRLLISDFRLQIEKSAPGQLNYLQKILDAFPSSAEKISSQLKIKSRKLKIPEPLSARELEVLSLMSAGLKYEEIAERLVVTLNTVRFHVKGIYGKLGVNSRTQAIEAARRLGLL